MTAIGVDAYGVPIGPLFLWLIVDFPISWIIVFGLDGFGGDAALLVGGGMQWGLIGWLFGKSMVFLTHTL